MFKRLIISLLVLLTVLSFAGCSGTLADSNSTSASSNTATTVATSTVSTTLSKEQIEEEKSSLLKEIEDLKEGED